MPFVINLARPQDDGPAKMIKSKCSFPGLRKWCGSKAKSVAQSEKADPVDDFLAHRESEIRQLGRKPPVQSPLHQAQAPTRRHESHDVPMEREAIRNMSTVSSMSGSGSTTEYAFPSTISLASTVSESWTPGYKRPALQRLPYLEMDREFHFPWSEQDQPVELSAQPLPRPQGQPVELPSQQSSQPRFNTFEIDSTPIAAVQQQSGSKPPFKTFSGSPGEKIPVKFQAYPGGPPPKPVKNHYIPPSLTPGYSNGVPPALRPRYSIGNESQKENTQPTSPGYSYPLVDFRDGLFLNANMSQRNVSYQEPRIPSMQFPNRGLHDEVSAELTRLRIPDEKQVVRPESVVRRESQAWMSPGSPLALNAYEMEASSSHTQEMPPYPMSPPPTEKRQTFSPISPLSDAGVVGSREYNWPRFSDQGFTDPAEEHSRKYRQRRDRSWSRKIED